MAKKDFTNINTNRVYSTIAEATAEPAQEAEEVQEEHKTRKERKTYTEQEAAEIIQSMNTSGRKGIKLPRINLAFSPANYEYIETMARVRGQNLTEFINYVIDQHRADHQDTYKKALEFRDSL